jgi:hypothetical protein
MFLMFLRAAHDIGVFLEMLTRSWGGIVFLGFLCIVLVMGIHSFQRRSAR